MNWIALDEIKQLELVDEASATQPVAIFKHSTRCNISATAIDRIERNDRDEKMGSVKWYYLDLLNHRDISQAIAQRYGIEHESPQVLLIRNGKCVYHANHFEIRFEEIIQH